MGLFNKKKDRVLDLTEGHYNRRRERVSNSSSSGKVMDFSTGKYVDVSNSSDENSQLQNTAQNNSQSSSGGFFGGFFGGGDSVKGNSSFDSDMIPSNSDSNSSYPSNESVNPDERRRQLNKKLKDMTEKIEDLSNQIYHLQNRMEVVERKTRSGNY